MLPDSFVTYVPDYSWRAVPGLRLHNPLTSGRDLDDRRMIEGLFPQVSGSGNATSLVLRPYLHRCPERFFNPVVHSLMLGWLTDRAARDRARLKAYFADNGAPLGAALLFLRQINAERWHDERTTEGDDLEIVRFIDQVVHPVYLRLTEGVLAPLIRPAALFSRVDRGKSTEGLDVFNLVEELRGGPLEACVLAYEHRVRNGIAHGGIALRANAIRYTDKKGNALDLELRAVVRLCDDLVDACNGLAAAVKTFLQQREARAFPLPHELLVEELVEETSTPWWSISGCIASELPGAKQLIIYARAQSRDRLKIQWAAVHAAATAESLAPGFDRYFFSLRDRQNRPGWASFDGRKLLALRERGANEVHEFATAFDASGFYYEPRPAITGPFRRLDTLIQSFRLNWPRFRHQVREGRGRPEIIARDGQIHRNAWGFVLRGSVVMPGLTGENAAHEIRAHRHSILTLAARVAARGTSRWSLARYLPLGYARVGVYSHDFRRRRFDGFGLGQELICTVQFQRIRRIKAPDIFGSTIESAGRWRIAWNRAWIESGGRVDDSDPASG